MHLIDVRSIVKEFVSVSNQPWPFTHPISSTNKFSPKIQVFEQIVYLVWMFRFLCFWGIYTTIQRRKEVKAKHKTAKISKIDGEQIDRNHITSQQQQKKKKNKEKHQREWFKVNGIIFQMKWHIECVINYWCVSSNSSNTLAFDMLQ